MLFVHVEFFFRPIGDLITKACGHSIIKPMCWRTKIYCDPLSAKFMLTFDWEKNFHHFYRNIMYGLAALWLASLQVARGPISLFFTRV
jgi:hypothetical protein